MSSYEACAAPGFSLEVGGKQREFGCEARQTTKNFLGWLVLEWVGVKMSLAG